ncbi:MAG TPA: polyprenyl synthetase family protein [Myxococcota bacterium]|nr:polyprenyl synthetase family protein [Myxococcota bacterium]
MTLLEDEFLAKTNDMIREVLTGLSSDTQSLAAIAEHLCLSDHAKRARPLLVLYFHWLFSGEVAPELVKVAVAAEFIHAASLLHDDVVDEASMRRGKASANVVYGNAQAVLAGDFLLTEAFDLLRPLGRELTDRAIVVLKEMTRAALVEINARGRMDLTIDGWSRMARGKTGVLFSWCGFAAAILANSDQNKERLWALGEHIGHIFQMVDDLKDFNGDQNLKDSCQDIRNKGPSLPIILAAQMDTSIMGDFQKYYKEEIINDETVLYLKKRVLESGAIAETYKRIKHAESKARALVASYEGSLGQVLLSQWVHTLIAWPTH